MAIKGMTLSWISVKDVQKSRDFFEKKLGLTVAQFDEKFGWVELRAPEGQTLGMCNESPEVKAGQNAIVTFETDTYDATKKELEAKGIIFFGEIAGIPGVPRMINFKDLDGNMFQLVEHTPGHDE